MVRISPDNLSILDRNRSLVGSLPIFSSNLRSTIVSTSYLEAKVWRSNLRSSSVKAWLGIGAFKQIAGFEAIGKNQEPRSDSVKLWLRKARWVGRIGKFGPLEAHQGRSP